MGKTAHWGTELGPCKAATRFGKNRPWREGATRHRA